LNRDQLPAPQVFISYKHGADFPFVESFVEYLKVKGLVLYLDKSYRPVEDPDGLSVGLSAGLAISPVMVAFVSKEYLESQWCLNELRHFIYTHGVRLPDDVITSRRLLLSQDQAALLEEMEHFIPLIFVAIDAGIDADTVAEALARKSRNENFESTNHRAGVLRGKLVDDSGEHEASLVYMRKQGIDASEYIAEIPMLNIRKMESVELVGSLVGLVKEAFLKSTESHRTGDLDRSPDEAWKMLWEQYGSKPNILAVPAEQVLAALEEGGVLDAANAQGEADLEEDLLFSFLEAIEARVPRVTYFDRRAACTQPGKRLLDFAVCVGRIPDSLQEYWDQLNEIRDAMIQKDLRPFSRDEEPLLALYRQAVDSDVIPALQRAYYRFILKNGRSDLVEIAVVACLSINVTQSFEILKHWSDIEELVLQPLCAGKPIREQFDCNFLNEAMMKEIKEVENYYRSVKPEEDHFRRPREGPGRYFN